MSMYGYCGGRPVRGVDPFGLEGDYPPDGSTYNPDGSTTYRWTDDAGQHVVTFTHDKDANGNYKGTRATVNDNTAKAWALKNWGGQLLNQKELQGEIGEQIRQDQLQHIDDVIVIVENMATGAKMVASVNPLTGAVVSAADFKDNPSLQSAGGVVLSLIALGLAGNAFLAAEEASTAGSAASKVKAIEETQQKLEELANKVKEAMGPGKGAVYGTKFHAEFERLVNELENAAIKTEPSFKGGKIVRRGVGGSIRADVILYDAEGNILAVYDLRTGTATLTDGRIIRIRGELPSGCENTPVREVRPQ